MNDKRTKEQYRHRYNLPFTVLALASQRERLTFKPTRTAWDCSHLLTHETSKGSGVKRTSAVQSGRMHCLLPAARLSYHMTTIATFHSETLPNISLLWHIRFVAHTYQGWYLCRHLLLLISWGAATWANAITISRSVTPARPCQRSQPWLSAMTDLQYLNSGEYAAFPASEKSINSYKYTK